MRLVLRTTTRENDDAVVTVDFATWDRRVNEIVLVRFVHERMNEPYLLERMHGQKSQWK